MSDIYNDEKVQHGIDDNPNEDAKKGLELGALGGGAVGAIAGAAAGPVGAIVGALIGGSVGSIASGAAVQAVDTVDNDNTVTGIGDGVTTKDDLTPGTDSTYTANTTTSPDAYTTNEAAASPITGMAPTYAASSGITGSGNVAGDYERGSYVGGQDVNATNAADVGGHNVVTGGPAVTDDGKTGLGVGAIAGGVLGAAAGGPVGAVVGGTLGSLAGGVAGDAAEAADTNDEVASTLNPDYNTTGARYGDIGNDTPGIQTGGVTTAGTDTRGIGEKIADTVTGDHTDDKTGGTVLREGTTNAADSVRNAAHNVGDTVSNAAHSAVHGGNDIPGVQTGGVTTAGTDTRGITEKAADAVTGDRTDDKTGGIVR